MSAIAIPLLLLALSNLQDLPEQSPAEVELEGTLVLTPVISRATDSPDFKVRFTSRSKTPFEATLLLDRAGILLDGRELSSRGYVWIGIAPTIGPGSYYDSDVSLGDFLPGSERGSFSKALGRWRWQVPLSSGPHRVVYFLRKTSTAGSTRIESNEVIFIWDDSQPLLYEPYGVDDSCPKP